MFYSVYYNSCVLRTINGAYYCTCSSVAPLVPEMFFWLAETRKQLNFLRCFYVFDLVLKYSSDIKEGIDIQLIFYFVILVNIVAPFMRMSFFHLWVRFSRIVISPKRLQLHSKTDLITNGLSLGFFAGIWLFPLTSYLYGLKSARIGQFF